MLHQLRPFQVAGNASVELYNLQQQSHSLILQELYIFVISI